MVGVNDLDASDGEPTRTDPRHSRQARILDQRTEGGDRITDPRPQCSYNVSFVELRGIEPLTFSMRTIG
jgi:hypothetical protein